VAASNHDGAIRLTDGLESSLNRVLEEGDGAQDVVEVTSRRLETVCESLHMAPDVIKMDVEGHEPAVLQGLGKYRDAARAILVERGDRPEILHWMRAAGYSGPWYVHFNRSFLSSKPQARPEDPLFINEALRGDQSFNDHLDLVALFRAVQPAVPGSASTCH
jgi:hypothetical protein